MIIGRRHFDQIGADDVVFPVVADEAEGGAVWDAFAALYAGVEEGGRFLADCGVAEAFGQHDRRNGVDQLPCGQGLVP